jgi:hypothetical protein
MQCKQNVPHILWNARVHNRVHKNFSLKTILSQISPIHTLT